MDHPLKFTLDRFGEWGQQKCRPIIWELRMSFICIYAKMSYRPSNNSNNNNDNNNNVNNNYSNYNTLHCGLLASCCLLFAVMRLCICGYMQMKYALFARHFHSSIFFSRRVFRYHYLHSCCWRRSTVEDLARFIVKAIWIEFGGMAS